MIRSLSSHAALFVALLVLIAMFPIGTERYASAQVARNADAMANKRVTLDLRNVRLTDALTTCCKQAGCAYRLSDAIKGFVARERRTVQIQNVPFKTVFEALLAPGSVFARSYSYRKVGNVFFIGGPKSVYKI